MSFSINKLTVDLSSLIPTARGVGVSEPRPNFMATRSPNVVLTAEGGTRAVKAPKIVYRKTSSQLPVASVTGFFACVR